MHHFDKSHSVISAKETLFTLQDFLMRIGKHNILFYLYIWISEETRIEASPLSFNGYTFWSMFSSLEYCAAKIFSNVKHIIWHGHHLFKFNSRKFLYPSSCKCTWISKPVLQLGFVFLKMHLNNKRVRFKSALFSSTNKRQIMRVMLFKWHFNSNRRHNASVHNSSLNFHSLTYHTRVWTHDVTNVKVHFLVSHTFCTFFQKLKWRWLRQLL